MATAQDHKQVETTTPTEDEKRCRRPWMPRKSSPTTRDVRTVRLFVFIQTIMVLIYGVLVAVFDIISLSPLSCARVDIQWQLHWQGKKKQPTVHDHISRIPYLNFPQIQHICPQTQGQSIQLHRCFPTVAQSTWNCSLFSVCFRKTCGSSLCPFASFSPAVSVVFRLHVSFPPLFSAAFELRAPLEKAQKVSSWKMTRAKK